jgi:hypothetical protein
MGFVSQYIKEHVCPIIGSSGVDGRDLRRIFSMKLRSIMVAMRPRNFQ